MVDSKPSNCRRHLRIQDHKLSEAVYDCNPIAPEHNRGAHLLINLCNTVRVEVSKCAPLQYSGHPIAREHHSSADFEFVPAESTESNKMVLVRLPDETKTTQSPPQFVPRSNLRKTSRMHGGKINVLLVLLHKKLLANFMKICRRFYYLIADFKYQIVFLDKR